MLGERVSLSAPSRASMLETALEIKRSDFLPGCQSIGEFVIRMVAKKLDPIGVEVEVTELREERAQIPKGNYKIDSLIEIFVVDAPQLSSHRRSLDVVYLEPIRENSQRVRYVVVADNDSFSFFGL